MRGLREIQIVPCPEGWKTGPGAQRVVSSPALFIEAAKEATAGSGVPTSMRNEQRGCPRLAWIGKVRMKNGFGSQARGSRTLAFMLGLLA
jgi:hypothetical protein